MLFILFLYSNLVTWQLKTKPKWTLNQVNGLKCSKNKKTKKQKERDLVSATLSLTRWPWQSHGRQRERARDEAAMAEP